MPPRKWDTEYSSELWDTNGLLNHDLEAISSVKLQKKKKRTCQPVDILVPADHKDGQILEPCQGVGKTLGHETDSDKGNTQRTRNCL